MHYLRIQGRLYPDNRLVLRHGYLDERPRRPSRRESAVRAELFDEAERLLLVHFLELGAECSEGRPSSGLCLRGWVPFPAQTQAIRFSRGSVQLHEIIVSRAKPTLELQWRPPEDPRGPQSVTWRGGHAEGLVLEYFCRYSWDDGRRWARIGWRTRATEMQVDLDNLPGGERCRIAIVATDGVNTTTVCSEPFPVEVRPCRVSILSPLDGQHLPTSQPVLLVGQGYFLEERRVEKEALRWHSSLDGELGCGGLLELDMLRPGEHLLTLTAGEGGRASTAAVRVHLDTLGQPNPANHHARQ